MSEWIAHVKQVAKDKGISYKDALKVAKASYKPKKQLKGRAVDPMEVVEKVGEVAEGLTSGIADSVSRFELWRDYVVPVVERELKKYGYSSINDPKINADWLSGGCKLCGGFNIGKVVGDVSRTETLRAIRILKKPLDILERKSGKKRDLKWVARQVGQPLKVVFPIEDIEDFVD